jgi:hypothetical protein
VSFIVKTRGFIAAGYVDPDKLLFTPSTRSSRGGATSVNRKTGAEAFVGIFSYGGMPYDMAEHSMRTFANEVVPQLRSVVPAEDQLIARAGTGKAADPSAFRLMVVAT